MRIHDLLLRAVLGMARPPDRVEFFLAAGGVEIDNTRVTVPKGGWTFGANEASTRLVFGPYGRVVRFDATPMCSGVDQLAPFPMAGIFELPAGMQFVREVTIEITTEES